MLALLSVFIPAGERAGRAMLLAASAIILTGCSTNDAKPGNAAVYEEIAAMTDCVELQATFDRNMDDVERRDPGDPLRDVVFGYANAANDRMRDLGC